MGEFKVFFLKENFMKSIFSFFIFWFIVLFEEITELRPSFFHNEVAGLITLKSDN